MTTDPSRPTLYHFTDCPFCLRVRVTLAELGVDYESVVLDPDADAASYPAAMREHSKGGKVPLLIHEGAAITESDRICMYLNDMFDGELMPSDGWAAARVRDAFDFGEERLGAPLYELTTDLDDRAVEVRREAIAAALVDLARWIHEGGKTLTGRFSLGDIALVPFLFDVARLKPALRGIPDVVARYAVIHIGRDSVRTDPRVAESEAVIEADDGMLRPAVAQILSERTKAEQPTFFIDRGHVYEGVMRTGPSMLSFNDEGHIYQGETAFGDPLATVGDDGELRVGRTATFGDLIAVVEPGAVYTPDRRDRPIARVPGADLVQTAAAAYVYLGLEPQLAW